MIRGRMRGFGWILLALLLSCTWAANAHMLHGQGVRHQHREQQLMVPASVQKVVTMFLAWHILGPQHHFHTDLVRVDERHYQVVFGFDPTFSRTHLDSLIAKLPKKTPLRLDLVSNGLTQPRHPHWMKEDLPYCYAAPVGPAIIDENCSTHVRKIPVSGPKKAKGKNYKQVSVTKPNMPYQSLPQQVKVLAKKHGVRLSSLHWVMQARPGHVQARHHSAPLTQVMHPGLKHSNNLVMDALWLASAQKLNPHKRITWTEASRLLSHYLKKKHAFQWVDRIHMDDGSGLSPKNRIYLAALNQLLVRIEGHDTLFRWAIKAFPAATIDGTMKNRFGPYKSQLRHANIITKTGTFKRVRNYCGWITSTSGAKYRFIWFESATPPERLRPRMDQESAMFRLIEPYLRHTISKPKKRS